jgi:hypothetical protein
MAKQFHCDVCKRRTDEIVGKMFYTMLTPGRGANNFSNNYSHHLDVGVCCADKLLKSFDWQPRQTAQEYHRSRRKSPKKKVNT